MDLVDKKDVPLLEIGQQRREVAGTFNYGSRGRPDVDAHLARDDVGERGFSQARRPVKQKMVQHAAAPTRRRDGHPEIRLDRLLADVFVETTRSKIDLVILIFVDFIAG